MRYFFIITALLTFLSNPAHASLVNFKYDHAGNMTSEQGKYYEYNDANQLVRVRKDSPTGEIIAEYVYDYQGQRVKKTENGVTTYYIGKHYEERKGKTVDEKTSYFFANSQRIAKSSQKNKAPPVVSYYLNNHLGSADVIIDENGNELDNIKYLPFGGYRTFPKERHTYTGKERDEVTDNYYFEARYYNPNIRRFTQADTIVPDLYDPQSLNRYAYVKNNPLRYTDPTGHAEDVSGLLGEVSFAYSIPEHITGLLGYYRYSTSGGRNKIGKRQGMVKNTNFTLANSYFKGVNEQLGWYGYGLDMSNISINSVDKVKTGEGSLSGQKTYIGVMAIHKHPIYGIVNNAASIVDIIGNAGLSISGSKERVNTVGVTDKLIESFSDPKVRKNRVEREYERLTEQNILECVFDRSICNMNWIEHKVWVVDEFLKD